MFMHLYICTEIWSTSPCHTFMSLQCLTKSWKRNICCQLQINPNLWNASIVWILFITFSYERQELNNFLFLWCWLFQMLYQLSQIPHHKKYQFSGCCMSAERHIIAQRLWMSWCPGYYEPVGHYIITPPKEAKLGSKECGHRLHGGRFWLSIKPLGFTNCSSQEGWLRTYSTEGTIACTQGKYSASKDKCINLEGIGSMAIV